MIHQILWQMEHNIERGPGGIEVFATFAAIRRSVPIFLKLIVV